MSSDFVKLRSLKFILLIFLLSAFPVYADEYLYKFKWAFINVAELKIKIEPNQNLSKLKRPEFFVSASTSGPLKIFRNYRSSINGFYLENKVWRYELIGNDRGQKEHKRIDYHNDSLPVVKIFIDDKGVNSSEPDINRKNKLIDPVSVLIDTIVLLRNYNNCDKEMSVYDGKRTYNISIKTIDTEKKSEEFIKCQYEISENSFLTERGSFLDRMNWPFNGGSELLNIIFSKKLNYIPVQFFFEAPIGNIEGKLEKM